MTMRRRGTLMIWALLLVVSAIADAREKRIQRARHEFGQPNGRMKLIKGDHGGKGRGKGKLPKSQNQKSAKSAKSDKVGKGSKSNGGSTDGGNGGSSDDNNSFFPHLTHGPVASTPSRTSKSTKSRDENGFSSKDKSSKSDKSSSSSSDKMEIMLPTSMPVQVTPLPTFASVSPTESPTAPQCETSIRSFWLIDTRSEMRLRRLTDGETISVEALSAIFFTTTFNIEAQTSPEMVGSVRFQNTLSNPMGSVVQTKTENDYPYFAGSEMVGVQRQLALLPGNWEIVATPFCEGDAGGAAGQPRTLTFQVESDAVDTSSPTGIPSGSPSSSPTGAPTDVPTAAPSPDVSGSPTDMQQTDAPTLQQSLSPTEMGATAMPTPEQSQSPTEILGTSRPSLRPSSVPSQIQETLMPTPQESSTPTQLDQSAAPSATPPDSAAPSNNPTPSGTSSPTASPTPALSQPPTNADSSAPSQRPLTMEPSTSPSGVDSVNPTSLPTTAPTVAPTGIISVVEFWLIRASTQERLQKISNGAVLDLGDLTTTFGTSAFQIEAETSPPTVGIVRFGSDRPLIGLLADSAAPYTTPESSGTPFSFVPGRQTISAIPFVGAGSSEAGESRTITFEVTGALPTSSPTTSCDPTALQIVNIWLVEATSGSRIAPITDGNTFNVDSLAMIGLTDFKFEVETTPTVGAVGFQSNMPLPDAPMTVDTEAPFSIPIDPNLSLDLVSGSWTLVATPFCDSTMQTMGAMASVSFKVTRDNDECSSSNLGIDALWLIDATDGTRLFEIDNGDTIVIEDVFDNFGVADLQLEAQGNNRVGAVAFDANNQVPTPTTDTLPPFTLPGTLNSPIDFVEGDWEVMILPVCDATFGVLGDIVSYNFTVVFASDN